MPSWPLREIFPGKVKRCVYFCTISFCSDDCTPQTHPLSKHFHVSSHCYHLDLLSERPGGSLNCHPGTPESGHWAGQGPSRWTLRSAADSTPRTLLYTAGPFC